MQFLKNLVNFNIGSMGLLGINARNVDYVFEYNDRKFFPLVDDKIKTKEVAKKANIPTPEVYTIVEHQKEIVENILSVQSEDFVVKPARGSGGGGITVITRRRGDKYEKASGSTMSLNMLRQQISNILSGLYSLGGTTDQAIIEYRVKSAKIFDDISYKGVPDIRIIVCKGYPVMAMLRLPTKQSDGKANLHAGGLGSGLCIATGQTTYTVQGTSYITIHPDTHVELAGIQIPNWTNLLKIAASFGDILPLQYIGVDLVLDETKGPMLLEVNARPGLAIQIANRSGLKTRLSLIENQAPKSASVEERVVFSIQNFKTEMI